MGYNSVMKPVVILNLITDALSGRPRRRLELDDPDRPITQREARREMGIAAAVMAVVLALILAFLLSFVGFPDP